MRLFPSLVRVVATSATLASALGAQTATPAPARTLPRVHLVATGGTIASTNYYVGEGGKVGVDALLKAVPALDTVARITAEQFANVASMSMTQTLWLSLSRGIADTLRAHPDLAGIVVTHGTDTMEETAFFLDLTVADPRPVVVTGAMRPADGVGIDGPANLLHAVQVAASPQAKGRGAMILMNDEILAARDAQKTNTTRPNAFSAPYRGDLGIADPERVSFFRPASRAPVFDLAAVRELPRVDIAYSYVGGDGADVDAFVAAGAKGIVVAGAGRGAIPAGQRQALDRAMAKGVVVVVGSRTGSGSVPVGTGTSRRAGASATIGAGDLNVQKARVLLMLALTRTSAPAEVAKIFQEHQ
jgi:L-asparaginase type II